LERNQRKLVSRQAIFTQTLARLSEASGTKGCVEKPFACIDMNRGFMNKTDHGRGSFQQSDSRRETLKRSPCAAVTPTRGGDLLDASLWDWRRGKGSDHNARKRRKAIEADA
jgi:hypothetical protein